MKGTTKPKGIGIRTMLFGIIAAGLLLLSIIVPASAYVYNGQMWENKYANAYWDSSFPDSWKPSARNAMGAWNNAGADFRFYEVSCQNKLYYTPLGSGSSTLARATWWYTGNYITKATIEFNSDKSWSTSGESGKFDVQSVATHEFGHWLSLGHSSNTDATMYAYIDPGETKKRTLHSDDIAGIKYIYGSE